MTYIKSIFISVIICVYILFSFLNELRIKQENLFLLNSLLVAIGLLYFSLSKQNKELAYKVSKFFLTLAVAGTFLHLILNSINIYQFELPKIFFELKLYRYVSISGKFLFQIISVFLIIPIIHSLEKVEKITFSVRNLIQILFVSVLMVIAFSHLQFVFELHYRELPQIFLYHNIGYNERFERKMGGAHSFGWVYVYTQFVAKHTPEDASIVIPPQTNVWPMVGNTGYIRWFLYPRKIEKLNDDQSIPESAEYILIALGDCNEGLCGFPKQNIEQDRIEHILLLDRDTRKETLIKETTYELDTDTMKWGIIKLKK